MHPDKRFTFENLTGKKVLITAGPTYERIDPVRFISNFSTGKMGYSLTDAFCESGANVSLISGPTQLVPKYPLHKFIKVLSAKEMYSACKKQFPKCEIAVLTAAVSDYRSEQIQDQKIKSETDNLILKLEKTEDIALELGKMKKPNQLLVGFALETEKELDNAREKLQRKKFDLIVLNSLQDKGAGFGVETNKITILDADNKIHKFGLKLKEEVAYDILKVISEKLV
jgi:phosphopantothenoylcysteine decarboxylase/phosphopantothenate--cysteine ligase